ncbi:MAG: hypothetical protein CM1200mP29_13000 [Verrucomicrobiota bacterium]|nr:MAG: hypothetical protein CM1200mP29_13000 [Verrucomicrobiota bacterium]
MYGRDGAAALSRLQRESRPMPDLILIDGGKGQLGMACRELTKLGLEHLPVIGLAKEFEEIYRPGKNAPLRLDLDSGALKLLSACATSRTGSPTRTMRSCG